MTNLKALEGKLEKLKERWEVIAFGSEFTVERKYIEMGKIEEEIYTTKKAIEKMQKVLGL